MQRLISCLFGIIFFAMLLIHEAQSQTANARSILTAQESWRSGSGSPSGTKPSSAVQSPEETLPPTAVVLTVHGACPANASTHRDKPCTTTVTRQEFDELMRIVAPESKINANTRRSVAFMYAELLAFETAARESGIENSPDFQETLRLVRLRTVADLYRHSLEKKSGMPSKEKVDEYYRREASRFEEVKLRRIVLPKNNFTAVNKEEFEKKVFQLARDLRERASKGEDVDQLQREAFAVLAFSGQPPSTDVGSRRRDSLLPEESNRIFSLSPGQVSQVENEPHSFVIYKVEAKRMLPEELVRKEITQELAKQEMESALKSIRESIHSDLHEKYFATSSVQPGDSGSR
jgi:hypothetical protein